jgi:hypothetical protein
VTDLFWYVPKRSIRQAATDLFEYMPKRLILGLQHVEAIDSPSCKRSILVDAEAINSSSCNNMPKRLIPRAATDLFWWMPKRSIPQAAIDLLWYMPK